MNGCENLVLLNYFCVIPVIMDIFDCNIPLHFHSILSFGRQSKIPTV